ncbi:hypothetical protein X801_04324, partial [Opisthorchis viverrini]
GTRNNKPPQAPSVTKISSRAHTDRRASEVKNKTPGKLSMSAVVGSRQLESIQSLLQRSANDGKSLPCFPHILVVPGSHRATLSKQSTPPKLKARIPLGDDDLIESVMHQVAEFNQDKLPEASLVKVLADVYLDAKSKLGKTSAKCSDLSSSTTVECVLPCSLPNSETSEVVESKSHSTLAAPAAQPVPMSVSEKKRLKWESERAEMAALAAQTSWGTESLGNSTIRNHRSSQSFVDACPDPQRTTATRNDQLAGKASLTYTGATSLPALTPMAFAVNQDVDLLKREEQRRQWKNALDEQIREQRALREKRLLEERQENLALLDQLQGGVDSGTPQGGKLYFSRAIVLEEESLSGWENRANLEQIEEHRRIRELERANRLLEDKLEEERLERERAQLRAVVEAENKEKQLREHPPHHSRLETGNNCLPTESFPSQCVDRLRTPKKPIGTSTVQTQSPLKSIGETSNRISNGGHYAAVPSNARKTQAVISAIQSDRNPTRIPVPVSSSTKKPTVRHRDSPPSTPPLSRYTDGVAATHYPLNLVRTHDVLDPNYATITVPVIRENTAKPTSQQSCLTGHNILPFIAGYIEQGFLPKINLFTQVITETVGLIFIDLRLLITLHHPLHAHFFGCQMSSFRYCRCHYVSFILSGLCRRMRVRSICSLISWTLLSLLFVSSFWRFACVIFITNPTDTPSVEPPFGSAHRVPSVFCSFNSLWAIPEFWPRHITTRVLPDRDLTVFIFSSHPPFPNSPQLSDPTFILRRKQVNDLLIASLHGLVSHVIWVYPSWRRDSLPDLHTVTKFELGIASISFADAVPSVRSDSQISEHRRRSLSKDNPRADNDRSELTTLCLCPSSGSPCTLPLLYSFNLDIPPETCSRNVTVVFEQVIDLIVESKLVQTTQPSDTKHNQLFQSLFTKWRSVSMDHQTTEQPWPLNSRFNFDQWPIVFLFEANYFGSNQPESRPVLVPPSSALITFRNLVQKLIIELLDSTKNDQLSIHLATRFVDLVIPTIPLNTASLWTRQVFGVCACDLPQSDLLTKSKQDSLFLKWATMLSISTLNRTDTCSRLQPAINPLLLSDKITPSAATAALNLWNWLCHLDIEDLLSIVSWVPCDIASSASSHHPVDLCPRSIAIHPSSSVIPTLEQSLLLYRLTSILKNLPVPRLITMVGHPTAGPSDQESTDHIHFRKLCDVFANRL